MASSSTQRDDDRIHRVDTEPPPPGGDAYGAVTKVGPLSKVLAAQMMCALGDEAPADSGLRPRTSIRPAPVPDAIPWVGDEDADATLEPTLLNGVDVTFVDGPTTPTDHQATRGTGAHLPVAAVVSHVLPSQPPAHFAHAAAREPARPHSSVVVVAIAVGCAALFTTVSAPLMYLLFR